MATLTMGWDRLRRRPELLLMVTLAVAAIVGFVVWKLGSEIREGETNAFDRSALYWVRDHLGGIAPLRAAMLDLTALGDTATLTLVVMLTAGFAAASWSSQRVATGRSPPPSSSGASRRGAGAGARMGVCWGWASGTWSPSGGQRRVG